MIGQDIAVGGIDDHARAGTLHFARMIGHVRQAEETPERVVAEAGLHVDGLADSDIDDGRCDGVDQRSEARHLLVAEEGRQRRGSGGRGRQGNGGEECA